MGKLEIAPASALGRGAAHIEESEPLKSPAPVPSLSNSTPSASDSDGPPAINVISAEASASRRGNLVKNTR